MQISTETVHSEEEIRMAQMSFTDVEPAMEMVQLADYMLKNYNWMVKEVERLSSVLADAGEGAVGATDVNSGIRAQYKNSDKVGGEVVRRDRKWQRLMEMQEKVTKFERAMETIDDLRDKTMMEYMLEGKTVTLIADAVLEISRRQAQEVKRRLVRKLAWGMLDHSPEAA